MKLAFFSPIAPQQSGIADYVADLLLRLSAIESLQLSLFVNIELSHIDVNAIDLEQLDNIEFIHFKGDEQNYHFEQYDQLIYHLGNNGDYHAYMLPVLKKYGGIIHLHDLVVQQVLAFETQVSKIKRASYLNDISDEYGYKIASYMDQLIDLNYKLWQTEQSHLLPAFGAYLRYADACIVHSDYAKNQILARFPSLSVDKIEQLYHRPERLASESSQKNPAVKTVVKLGVFGGVESNRKVDVIIEVLAKLNQENALLDFELIVVGAVNPVCEDILKLPEKLAIEDKVTFYHRVEKNNFLQLLQSIDLLIALRQPSTGETSAIVMQALQLHKVVLVSDTGWYAELADFIDKVDNAHLKQSLSACLLPYLSQNDGSQTYLQDKQQKVKAYVKNELDSQQNARQYQQILEKHSRSPHKKILLDKLVHHLSELEITDSPVAINAMVNCLR